MRISLVGAKFYMDFKRNELDESPSAKKQKQKQIVSMDACCHMFVWTPFNGIHDNVKPTNNINFRESFTRHTVATTTHHSTQRCEYIDGFCFLLRVFVFWFVYSFSFLSVFICDRIVGCLKFVFAFIRWEIKTFVIIILSWFFSTARFAISKEKKFA